MMGMIGGGGFDPSQMRAMMGNFNPQDMQAKMAEADTDGSGGLSIEEFQATDMGAKITEAKAAEGQSIEDVFAQMDADGDGELTQADREARMAERQASFSSDMMSTLLALQEESQAEETDLVETLTEILDESDSEDEDELVTL